MTGCREQKYQPDWDGYQLDEGGLIILPSKRNVNFERLTTKGGRGREDLKLNRQGSVIKEKKKGALEENQAVLAFQGGGGGGVGWPDNKGG